MSKEQLSDGLIALSVLSIILAVIGAFGYDLWLASTQWLLIAIVLTAYGLYARAR